MDDSEFNKVMIEEGKPQSSWSDDSGEGFDEDSKNINEELGVDDGDLLFDLDDLDAETDDYDLKLTVDIGEEVSLEEDMELDDLDLAVEDLGLDLVDDDALDLELGDDSLELRGDDDQFNLDQDASSKLDLARAYIEMGDIDGAKPLLEEVLSEGDDEQVREASELIGNIR